MTSSKTSVIFPQWRGRDSIPDYSEWVEERQHVRTAWTDEYPRLDRVLASQDPWMGYRYWAPPAGLIPASADDDWYGGFLLWNIERFEERFMSTTLPDEFRLHYRDHFIRIIEQIRADPSFAKPGKDLFMKELGLTRCTLVPAMCRVLYPYAGIPGKIVLKNGLRAIAYTTRCGGRRPLFESHLHKPMLKDYFNPAGTLESHRLIALAYGAFPDVGGVTGTAWYNDPNVAVLSPHLAYLRDVPLSRGAMFLRADVADSHTGNAISTSKTRHAAYTQGLYKPRGYALLWSKRDMLG